MPHRPGEKSQMYDRSRYHEAKRRGLCVRHGCTKPPIAGRVLCAECQEYFNRARKRSESKYKRRQA